jgi:hypothetical protein
VTTLFGHRDAQGVPSAITLLSLSMGGTQAANVTFDDHKRPTRVDVTGVGQIAYEWTSGSVVVSAFGHGATISQTYGWPAGLARGSIKASTTAPDVASYGAVQATLCGAPMEDSRFGVTVRIEVPTGLPCSTPSGTVMCKTDYYPSVSRWGYGYTYDMASAGSQVEDGICEAIDSLIGSVCDVLDKLPPELQPGGLFCEFVALVQPELVPLCLLADLSMQAMCGLSDACTNASVRYFLNILNAQQGTLYVSCYDYYSGSSPQDFVSSIAIPSIAYPTIHASFTENCVNTLTGDWHMFATDNGPLPNGLTSLCSIASPANGCLIYTSGTIMMSPDMSLQWVFSGYGYYGGPGSSSVLSSGSASWLFQNAHLTTGIPFGSALGMMNGELVLEVGNFRFRK